MTSAARTQKTTHTTEVESPSTAASRYQQLRSHLAELKLHAAAEALPAVLDQATAEGLSLTIKTAASVGFQASPSIGDYACEDSSLALLAHAL
jgi:hypothetical protein